MAEETKNNLTDEEIEENEDVEDQDDNKDDSGKSGKDDKSGKDKSGDDKGKSGKTFTQEQVNKMMTREKNQGRSAALKELGIDPKDSKMVAMVKALIDSQKTDEQKATENQNKMNEAEQRAQIAEAKAEAMMLGVKTQYVDDVVTLALSKMTEDSDLKTIIGEFKTKYSIWFGESDDDKDKNKEKGKTGQKGTGSSVKTSKEDKGKGEEKGLGARLATQRRGTGKKFSYWGNNK